MLVIWCWPQAVCRSADYAGGDAVEAAIMAMVRKDVDDGAASSTSRADADGSFTSTSGTKAGFELSTATHWPGVAAKDVLVAPHEARLAWREFMSASALSVQQVSCPHVTGKAAAASHCCSSVCLAN
jgi:hypothetical protein